MFLSSHLYSFIFANLKSFIFCILLDDTDYVGREKFCVKLSLLFFNVQALKLSQEMK